MAQAVSASSELPLPVCSKDECTVTFEYSGAAYVWTPPTGASNLRFDLYGAQGGQGAQSSRGGGLGGRVTGSLTAVPERLLIYVGGSGVKGAGVGGGFNGGGDAGKGHGDEGSGGGATDLRMTSALEDRVVVAGGGGGTGGYNWSNAGLGGNGGGLTAGAGGWAQAAPGLGGSQTSGGTAGLPNGGSAGSAGSLGIGGRGASSFFSGGGGGGGGYFGGGGGGSDTDSCCYNAGGGGGGSSFADAAVTSGVEHFSGVRVGNGYATVTYFLAQVLVSSTPSPSPTASASPSEIASPSASAEPSASPESTPTPSASSSETPLPSAPPAEPNAPSLTAAPVASQLVELIVRPTQQPIPAPSPDPVPDPTPEHLVATQVNEAPTSRPISAVPLPAVVVESITETPELASISNTIKQVAPPETDAPQESQTVSEPLPTRGSQLIIDPPIPASILLGGLLGFWVSRLKKPRKLHSLARI